MCACGASRGARARPFLFLYILEITKGDVLFTVGSNQTMLPQVTMLPQAIGICGLADVAGWLQALQAQD